MLPLLYLPLVTLSSYCLAGSLMEHFAIYPGWLALSSSQSLITVYKAQSLGTSTIFIGPKLGLTGLIIVKLFNSPSLTAWISLALLLLSWVTFFIVQIPLQIRIMEIGDREAIERLIASDWVRVLAMGANLYVVTLSELE